MRLTRIILGVKYICWIPKLKKLFAFCLCMDKIRSHKSRNRKKQIKKIFSIYEYAVDEQRFNMEITINGETPAELVQAPFTTACYVINQTKDFVFIVGVGSIIIFDFRQFRFHRCKISCPTIQQHSCSCCCKNYSAICTSNRSKDKLMVYGYIHDLYKNKEEMQSIRFPSKYVIEIILKNIWTEWIHLMRDMITSNVEKTHVKIRVDELIDSCHDVINN